MARILVSTFLGIAPKIQEDQLAQTQAQIAQDCSLWSHSLRPVDGLANGVASPKLAGTIQKLYRYQNTWLTWTQDVDIVKGPIAGDALDKRYFTGTDKPRVTSSDIFNVGGGPGTFTPPFSYILGIPAPTTAPGVALGAAGVLNGNFSYVFTYVRKFSDGYVEESAPSPPSANIAPVNQQVNVTCPNDALVFADYGVTHKNIYRSNGGGYFFDQQIVIGNVAATADNIATALLGGAITTTLYLPPPDTLAGLILLPNRCLAGFVGNLVYISDPGAPHAYPLLNRWVIRDQIIGLGNVGSTIVAITKSVPEHGFGFDPAAYQFVPAPGPYPCTSKRSIKSGDIGALWSTPRGIAISDGSTISMATGEFLTEKEWTGPIEPSAKTGPFFPSTIHAEIHDGRYYGWFSTGVDGAGNKVGGGFVLDRTERAFLTTLGAYVEAAHAVPDTDTMFVSMKSNGVNVILQWDADPSNPFTFTWFSKLFIGESLDNMAFGQIIADYASGLTPAQIAALNAQIAAVQAANTAISYDDGTIGGDEINGGGANVNGNEINGDGVTQLLPMGGQFVPGFLVFRYYGDRQLKATVVVGSNDPFPLPAGYQDLLREFSVSGSIEVHKVALATSIEGLAAQ